MAKAIPQKAREEIAKLYLAGEKMEVIALLFGITASAVGKVARVAGLPHRSPHLVEAARKRNAKKCGYEYEPKRNGQDA